MTDCGGDDSVALGRGSTLRLSRLIVLSPWQRIDPPSLLSYLLGRGSLLPPYCLISMAEAPSSLPIVLSPWQRIPPPFLLSYLLQLAEASSFLPIVLSPLQRFSFLLPYCIIFLAERLLPPSLLSYLLGREAHFFPPCYLLHQWHPRGSCSGQGASVRGQTGRSRTRFHGPE